MESSRSHSNRGKWIANCLLAVASIAVTLIVLFLFDLLAQRISQQVAASNPDRDPHIAVSEYHHGLEPSRRYMAQWGDTTFEFNTNSLGMRDSRVRDVPLQSSKRRILFMGDSFTEAPGLSYEKSFVGRIAAKLAENGTEVLNGGVASYSSIIYWVKTKHLLEKVNLKFDELIVMIDISDIYDGTTYTLDRHGNVIKRRFLKRVQEFIEQNTLIARRISSFLYGHYMRMAYWTAAAPAGAGSPQAETDEATALAANHHHALWTIRDDLFEQYGRTGLSTETQSLDRLASLLRQKGIRMTIAVYPWPSQIWYQDFESRQVTYWRAWAEKNNVGFVNIFPAFFARDRKEASAVIRRNFIPGDVHWNESGHELVADVLLKAIRTQ